MKRHDKTRQDNASPHLAPGALRDNTNHINTHEKRYRIVLLAVLYLYQRLYQRHQSICIILSESLL